MEINDEINATALELGKGQRICILSRLTLLIYFVDRCIFVD